MRARATRRNAPQGSRRPQVGPLRFAALTDQGPREGNEDAYAYVTPDTRDYDARIGGSIFVLSDGMGGHGGGEVASQITVRETIKAYASAPGSESPAKRLHQAIVQANARVIAEAASGVGNSEMGSTVVACAIRDGHMVIGHVGDSRAYLVRGGSIQQLTRDHLYVTDVLRLPDDEASVHPMKHVLSRAVGRAGSEPDVMELTTQPGDRLLLCSDGVSNVVSQAEMRNALGRSDPKEAVMSIMTTAKQRARDNITALVVSVPGRDAGPKKTDRARRRKLDGLVAAMGGGFLVLVLLAAMLAPKSLEQAKPSGKVGGAFGRQRSISLHNTTGKDIRVRPAFFPRQDQIIGAGETEDVIVGEAPWLSAEQGGKIYEIDVAGSKQIAIGDTNFRDTKYNYLPYEGR